MHIAPYNQMTGNEASILTPQERTDGQQYGYQAHQRDIDAITRPAEAFSTKEFPSSRNQSITKDATTVSLNDENNRPRSKWLWSPIPRFCWKIDPQEYKLQIRKDR
jgi:hypothetical protein